MPVIGFLGPASAAGFAPYVSSFRRGLDAAGFVEGRNAAVEYRWADNQLDRLPAAFLVGSAVVWGVSRESISLARQGRHPLRVTACAICGSDLHIYGGIIPSMKSGDILGHENMGEVVEVGSEVKNLKVGDRVVVPFTIACGECFFCRNGFYSGCERTNPDHEAAAKLWGNSPAGLFGYSHLLGGYADVVSIAPLAGDPGLIP